MVSIIIPTYKGSDKVKYSVYCALQQTYKPIEVIVVDDNGLGTDEQIKTKRNLQSLIDKNLITYVAHESNMNGSAARNTGFSISKGEYVNFLDDDDFMIKNKIEKQVDYMRSNPDIDVVVCCTYFVHENGKGFLVKPHWDQLHIQRDYLCKTLFNTSAMLIRRNAVEDINGFDISFKRHQDWEFSIRMMEKHRYGCVCDNLLIKYATNRNTPGNNDTAVKHYTHFMDNMNSYLIKLGKADYDKIVKTNLSRLFQGYVISRNFKGADQFRREFEMNIIDLGKAYAGLMLHVIQIPFRRRLVKPVEEYKNSAQNYFKRIQ